MDQSQWRRVEAICDEALKLSSEERRVYLDRTCGADAALRRDVESLLVHEGTAERFLNAPVGAVAAQVMAPHDIIGRQFGDYEITGKLGEGGMGEVYRARDRKLGRDVSIKILPPAFATDRERMQRFEREARLLATVNHQFIGAIYGSIDIAGLPGLVLELVDGDTLSATLSRGALALPRALTIASQIADALDHAHRRGITHRDLKPSNIMLTRAGVKLLDFGIGKWTPPATDGPDTRPSTVTGEGTIVGTLHYMSPEQLEGRAVDPRSDIFSFGAVLFEMLAGRKAFDGQSQASIMAAVIEAPRPRLSDISGPHSSRLDRVLGKCLAKDPDERWQSARDLGDELRWLADDVTKPESAQITGSTRSSRWLTAAAVTTGVIAVALIGWTVRTWPRPDVESTPQPLRFTLQTAEGTLLASAFDISADGRQLVYVVRKAPGAPPILEARRLDRFEAFTIPGTERSNMFALSPDGQWVAFVSNGVLKKARVSADAKAITLVENLRGTFQVTWPADDAIYLVARNLPIRRVTPNGGRPEAVTAIQAGGEVDHHGPELLPDGKTLLFTVHGARNRYSIAAQLPNGEGHKTIVESGFAPRYLPSGHLVFGRGSSLMAVRFDARQLEARGDPVTVLENVSADGLSGITDYRLSRQGTLVYQQERPTNGRLLVWIDRAGRQTPLPLPARNFDNPRVSPDGKQIAFVVDDNGRTDIFTYEIATGRVARLTQDGANWGPMWTANGSGILFGRDAGAMSQLVSYRPNGGPLETLAQSINNLWPTSQSRDGEAIIVTQYPPTEESFLSRFADGALATFFESPGWPRFARLSPDSRWLAYTELLASRLEVFVQSYPDGGLRRQITADGGRAPVWSHDGKELYFRQRDRILGVPVDTSAGLKWGTAAPLFDARFVTSLVDYDIAPDGRFLMIKPDPGEDVVPPISVVVNWHVELGARFAVPR